MKWIEEMDINFKINDIYKQIYVNVHKKIIFIVFFFLNNSTQKKQKTKRNKNMSNKTIRNLSYFVFSGNYMDMALLSRVQRLYFLSYTVYLVNKRNPTYNLCCKPFQNL